MLSGRYRVTINGFTCLAETWDDALQWDGKRDEVFISWSVKDVNKVGQDSDRPVQMQSPVMGDTGAKEPANRIQAGSASNLGGIRSGDSFPSGTPWIRTISLSQERNYPPMKIWEGDLIQGERVVFITPTIWEWDPGESMWEGWMQWFQETDTKFGEKAKEVFTPIWPPAQVVFPAISLGIQTAATLFNVGGPIGNSGRRPIGFKQDLSKDPNGRAFSFEPQILALDYDHAERLIGEDMVGLGKGVLAITYDEAPYFRGNYVLYLQVEKIGSPPAPSVIGIGESLGGIATSSPTICSWGQGRLDIFVRGTDNALYHKWYDGSWNDWEFLGGALTSNPAAVSWGNGRIDVFARGTDNTLYHKWYDGNWNDWESLGGILTSGPAVCSWSQGRLDIFVRGADNALYHKWYDGSWNDWEFLDGALTSNPAAVSWGNGRIDVSARGTDNALYHKWYDGSWNDWESLGGALTSGPAVSSWGNSRIDVFVRGTDNALYHKWYDGSWNDWESLGGILMSDPAAVSWGSNRIDIVAQGTDNAIWHKFWDGAWKP